MYTQNNQSVILWDIGDGREPGSVGSLQCVLHSHTRAVSGMNWSPFVWSQLLTCSVDAQVCKGYASRQPTALGPSSLCRCTR